MHVRWQFYFSPVIGRRGPRVLAQVSPFRGAALALILVAMSSFTSASAAEHPVLLWTPERSEAIRERLRDPDAATQRQLQRTLALAGAAGRANPTVIDLFRAVVLKEQAPADAERQALLQSVGRLPEPLTWDKDPATLEWNEGMPSAGDRHMRDERSEDAFRYDLLRSSLTPEQQTDIEAYFKAYIRFHLDGHPPRHPHFRYDRTSWLPNMHWPRPIGTHLQALALQDEELIRAMFHADGGWKWYFDHYLADQGFYMEEFGKYYSNTGAMLLWCEGLEALGLGEMGYGYEGQSGITMRSHLRANTLDLAYPATLWDGGMPSYGKVTMGDGKGRPLRNWPLQHTVVTGYLPSGDGGNKWMNQSRMNGPMAKFLEPLWFEIAHQRWPEDGYDFFLAAMRAPDEDLHYPSLLFNLEAIDPEAVQPPTPTPSYLARERGFAFLRSDHSPGYWTGPRPAVALQFARYYVHYVHDSMSLLGLHAFNAPMVVNAWGTGRGYAGGDLWRDSVRGHSGVVVDNLQAKPVARRDDGSEGHRYRENLDNELDIRFAGVRADGVYPGVAHERLLVVGEHYVVDITWLRNSDSETPRRYEWQVLSPMSHQVGEQWQPSDAFADGALYQGSPLLKREGQKTPDPTAVYRRPADAQWPLRLTYQPRGESVEADPVHHGFVRRGLGMDVHVISEAGEEAFVAIPPGAPSQAPPTLLMLRREVPETVFAVVYAPFANNQPVVRSVQRLAATDGALALLIEGEDASGQALREVVALAYGDAADQEQELKHENGLRLRFRDHAVLRLDDAGGQRVTGNLLELQRPADWDE